MKELKRLTKLLFLCFILFPFLVCCSAGNQVSSGTSPKMPAPQTPVYDKNGRKIVDELPCFKHQDVTKWIAKNTHYPAEAARLNLGGVVYVNFFVDRDGKVVDPKVVRPVHPLLDREAIRVVKSMPDWEPGKLNGEPVKVECTVPIRFYPNSQNFIENPRL